MNTTTEVTYTDVEVMNLHHFEWDDSLYIEMDSMDSIKVTCKPDRYIQLLRNLLCSGKPVINDDSDCFKNTCEINQLKEIKKKLNSMAILED